MSVQELVNVFDKLIGSNDLYGSGFPSRLEYVAEKNSALISRKDLMYFFELDFK